MHIIYALLPANARYVKILDLQITCGRTTGDQFRPAMRAGWLSYIRQAYPDNAAPAAGPPVGGRARW